MQELIERYLKHLELERNVSAYTVRNYAADLLGNYSRGTEKGFLQFLDLKKIKSPEDVNKHTIRDYLAWLKEKDIGKPSIARKLSAVRSFFNYLVEEKIISASPAANISSPKLDKRLPSFLTTNEMMRLLEAPDLTTPQGQRDRALLEMLYASGLRVSEIASLTLRQVNLDTREIRVRGKGSKDRVVLIGEPAARALTDYLKQSRDKLLDGKRSSALFLNRWGGRLTERSVQETIEEYAKRAGIGKRVHPHMLRHTFATHLLDGGADLRVVQELLGHANLASTEIYTHVSKSRAKKVYLAAHPMAQEKDES